MNTPNFKKELAANQSRQILQSFGLNTLKQTFYNFGPAPEQDEPDKYSMLGTPVFDTITFYGNGTDGGISYYDLQQQKIVTVPKMTLDIALITVNKNILISKTNIQGAPGSVKQYITLDDYDIEIKCIVTSEIPDTSPDQQIRQIHKITSATCEVNVASNFLTLFGITCVVFHGQQPFMQDESARDVRKFTLNCLSETPFSIKVTQQGTTTSNNKPK